MAQNNFDREYRRAERNYRKEKIGEVESSSKSEPAKFWDSIKRLGPRNKQQIPMEVYDTNGQIVGNLQEVLDKWKREYSSLYNFKSDKDKGNNRANDEYNPGSMNSNVDLKEELNREIGIDEVERVIQRARCNKSVGIDNLPYEIFKGNRSSTLLTVLLTVLYLSLGSHG